MQAYTAYKSWWKTTQAPNLIPSLYWGEHPEEAFTVHINSMSLYELMEKLELWD